MPIIKPQDTFNHVSIKLAAQGRPSHRSVSDAAPDQAAGCLYRGDNGDRCAAGHCFEIPEGSTLPENVSVFDSTIRSYVVDAGHNIDLVARLQTAHDTAVCPPPGHTWLDRWYTGMRAIAADYRFSTEVLDAAVTAARAKAQACA